MKTKKIALLGNPNTGKTSIFNRLTGLNQHVGNFPGITVDLKAGLLKNSDIEIIDFPGTYSIYPHSRDEQVVYEVLSNPQHDFYPDLTLVIVDAGNLERNLLLFTQLYDLAIPLILVINMSDVAHRKGIFIQVDLLRERFPNARICETNARAGLGIPHLVKLIKEEVEPKAIIPVLENFELAAPKDLLAQQAESEKRFLFLKDFVSKLQQEKSPKTSGSKIAVGFWDKITVHPLWGYVIFAFIMLFIFQLIFSIASLPMDLIDNGFSVFADWLSHTLPPGVLSDLLCGGIIPGLGGVLVFLPQIILLFLCLGILEETGYLARAVFIMDRLMRPFGLNGKSVVPLVSSIACAIPGIMATRTIPNWKERLTTIMVAPLMSCSARIPVFTLLIALVIPEGKIAGFIDIQGLVLFALYSLGIVSALVISWVISSFIKTEEKSFFLLEIPSFKKPRWTNIGISLYEKSTVFVLEAGKVILIISILLWALASYGPPGRMDNAVRDWERNVKVRSVEQYERDRASVKLENSFIGILGKTIEPLIKPLGFDWKMGISLITSFAAREVFVGSMATIYSVHQEDSKGLVATMRAESYSDGKPVYTLASGLSLMVFYVYAMQCMATLAVVKRETKSWKWPLIQVGYMGILAYLAALFVFQILN